MLAGLALLAGAFAVLFALTGTTPNIPGFAQEARAKLVAAPLQGFTAYDPPPGDGQRARRDGPKCD